jgi:hypothetical protein
MQLEPPFEGNLRIRTHGQTPTTVAVTRLPPCATASTSVDVDAWIELGLRG